MQEKLKILFDKINLEERYYSFFIDSKLEKVQINEKAKIWRFMLEIKETLPIDVYDQFKKLLLKAFPNLVDIDLVFKVKEIKEDIIKDYYLYFINKSDKKILKVFADNNIYIDKEEINIEVINKAEYSKLGNYLKELGENFKKVGYSNQIKLIINEEKRENIKREIKEDTAEIIPTKKKEASPIIIGEEIKRGKIISLKDIISELKEVVIEAYVFGIDKFESSKNDFKIITLKVSDYTDSLYAKVFTRSKDEYEKLCQGFVEGKWYRLKGYIKNDQYAKDLVLNIRDAMEIKAKDEERIDTAQTKRVELHTHTHMSQMDGVVSVKNLIKKAKKWGHKAIAITDHNGCQGFPEAYYNAEGIKVIYGAEVGIIDDSIDIVLRDKDLLFEDATFVVFDFETTGLNATSGDSIIEVGAVKLCKGEIVDTFQELIDPGTPLSSIITKITGITDAMVKGKNNEETVIKRFQDWISDFPVVAHNAKFDVSFLESAYQKYDLGEFKNTVIDTLELSRIIDSTYGRHGLSQIVKRYDIDFDESGHHRADYDAKATAFVFVKMLKKLENCNIENINQIKDLVSKEALHKIGSVYHITLLAKNDVGLKNLFKIISLMNTKYLYKTPRILRSEIEKYREGLLVGSGCSSGEVFTLARSKSDEEMNNIIQFYDYIEIQPIGIYDHLLQTNNFTEKKELEEHIKKIIRIAYNNNKLVVATGDVHHLDNKDKIYREIIINQKVPGGGRHPLARDNIKNIPDQSFLTTDEMLEGFYFIEDSVRKEIVIDNTNKIADMIEEIAIIKKDLYAPKMVNSDKIVTDMVYQKAKSIYGDNLPLMVQARIDEELNSIIGNGFDVIYLISQKLVKKSNDDGYIVGSRGSVGSSFAATMMGITEVNPLPPHYICNNCKTSLFEEKGVSFGSSYSSGYDLPDKKCVCGELMKKEGQDMPFATFLGFKGDKVPDIDLNFSGEYQARAHDYTKELFGESNVFRAGTIGTVAAKTAYGFVKGYIEDKNKILRPAEQERLAIGCTGVKRTTGQHPGGIIVIPDYMEVFDFTPYQYPADDVNSSWYTTHFDFHAIHDNILKLDILGHDDPTMLRVLEDLTKIKIDSVPFDDEKVLSLFSSPKVLGVNSDQIMCETGTLGVPEFGTNFVIEMLKDTKPNSFAELVKISGLSHGTDVWLGNAKELIQNKKCEFKDVIGCRDDIMVYLMYHGLEPIDAFKIMEFVRKGKPSSSPAEWAIFEKLMREKDISDWYIESCQKIKYMFPKAHATAYVMMAFRVAWFKVYYPLHYYAAYFSVRITDYDIETMIDGNNAIKQKIIEINNKGYEKTNKETAILDSLISALEMTARGYQFGNIDLYKSDSFMFIIDDDQKTLIPPFITIDGLGDIVAKKIISERLKGEYISIEDLQNRARISQTLIDKMRLMGILKGMPESSQLSLFDI